MTDTTMLEVQTARETHRKNSESSIKDLMEPEGAFRLKDKVSQVCQILQSVRSVHTEPCVDSTTTSLLKLQCLDRATVD